MTKEEWAQVQEALKRLFSMVKLRIDEYEVSLVLERIGTYEMAITIYVNGVVDVKWLMEDCEERRRFMCRRERSIINTKQKAFWKKLSKKSQKELAEQYNRKYAYYQFYWTSFASLKKHLIANNQNIELVSIN